MFFLVVTFCLLSDPSECKEVNFSFEEDNLTPQQCVLYGQQHMARYIVEHPGERIVKFRCSRNIEKGI